MRDDKRDSDLVLNIVLNHLHNLGEGDQKKDFLQRLLNHVSHESDEEKDYQGIFITRRFKDGIHVLSNTSALFCRRDSSNGIMIYEVGRSKTHDLEAYSEYVKEGTEGWEKRQFEWIKQYMN